MYAQTCTKSPAMNVRDTDLPRISSNSPIPLNCSVS